MLTDFEGNLRSDLWKENVELANNMIQEITIFAIVKECDYQLYRLFVF